MTTVLLLFDAPAGKPNLFQRIIQWRTLGEYTHVSMALPAGVDGWDVWEAREGGIRVTPSLHSLAAPGKRRDIVRMPVHEWEAEEMERWWKAHEGSRYDMIGLIELASGRPSSRKEAWFCSEACLAALQNAGILTGVDTAIVSPQALYYLVVGWTDNERRHAD